ncbi:MAG: response regulator [Candidatus Marinimicrobia bacterium]|nr:response regulator [Candidatus Neomarinimicrobiota bacterium]
MNTTTNTFRKLFTKLENAKIGTLLKIGFAGLILFVIMLGAISYQQTNEINQQTEDLYNHPLQVRESIGELKSNIYAIRVDMKNLFLTTESLEQEADLAHMDLLDESAIKEMEIIRSQYLGPVNDVEALEYEYKKWKTMRTEVIRLLHTGQVMEGAGRTKSSGSSGQQAEAILRALEEISLFASGKGEELFAISQELSKSLNRQLIFITSIIVLISLLISRFILGVVRKPIDELIDVTQRFRGGDFTARSSYTSENEFGELSNSYNTLADSIQANLSLNKKIENISGLMLSEDDTSIFFHKVLQTLYEQTDSQIAAVYLLSDDQKSYEHFQSIGLDNHARQSFAADNLEGELGAAISTRKVQHIKNIPEDTRFAFHTVSGKFIPREILTIPVHANNGVIAVISLASLGLYNQQSIQFIDNILNTLSARVEGLLAYGKIKEFSATLEHQNTELEASKMELSAQSAELVEQNTELELQKKQLSHASQLKTAFFSNMSHELRTPLNSVIALSGVLYKRLANKISEEEYSYIEVIKRNGKNLLSLINDILDMARIEAGHEDLDIIKFNSTDLIDDIVSSLSFQANQKNIQLIHTKTDPNLFITSDVKKCRHILQNLISNAVKFTEKGKVEVSEIQNENGIKITVSDTGIGISEDQITYIFDEFNQADSSTSRKFGGTGLGLAIAKKYANMLGGIISVKSKIGHGSEFTLTLPLQYASENKIVDSEISSHFKHQSTQSSLNRVPDQPEKTILLVDDSEPALIQMKDILEESGYHLLLAHDGGEALELIENSIPDAMILDLMMPGIDGFQVLKSIREQKPTAHLPVLILTAKHITKAELKFLKSNNVQELIQKGDVNPNALLGAVANMLFPETEALKTLQPEPPTIKGKPVVLIVEDNPDNMLSAKAVLSDGFTVLEAVDGIEGVEMAKKFKPNLILMDIALPQMDGIEAFKKIRNDPELHHVKVIALTASAMTQDREIVLAHGFDSFIPKPIDEQIFFTTINRVLYGK